MLPYSTATVEQKMVLIMKTILCEIDSTYSEPRVIQRTLEEPLFFQLYT